MKDVFWGDVRGISALRGLLLVGRDEEVLGEMIRSGERKSSQCNVDWIGPGCVVETCSCQIKRWSVVGPHPTNQSAPPAVPFNYSKFNLTVS
jgi:hypothetical protein